MTLEDFEELLKSHDWLYYFSDSISVYKKGKENHDKLIEISKQSPEYQKLYSEYEKDNTINSKI